MKFPVTYVLFVLPVILMLGCGGERIPKLGEVNGTLKLNGQPLPNVRVSFLPDPEEENSGRPSRGTTDENGQFTLFYNGDKNKPGTSIGWNRVILTDITAINSSRDDNPIPRRFAAKYQEARTTPLKFDIKSGSQTIDLNVEE